MIALEHFVVIVVDCVFVFVEAVRRRGGGLCNLLPPLSVWLPIRMTFEEEEALLFCVLITKALPRGPIDWSKMSLL